LRKPVAFVFGSEAEGLSAAWRRVDMIQASVPMRGKSDSLNVATSAALFFYEAIRQRGAVE
jgi:TrmH family RNA methyltransferase